MALYHFHAEPVRRSQGASSVDRAAYQSRSRIQDERLGKASDWTWKPGIVESAILAPGYAPAWMTQRAALWNANEAAERRKDAQLGMWYDIALPHELTDAQRREMLHGFVRDQWVARGLVCDVAIHLPEGRNLNHHAHVLVSSRLVMPEGFGEKAFRGTIHHRRMLLEADREAWANHHNRYFERHGLPSRIDHRSYEARMIDREATLHLGNAAAEKVRKGEPSRIAGQNTDILSRNSERARAWRDIHEEGERIRELIWIPSPRRPPAPPPVRREFNNPEAFKTRLETRWSERDQERRVALESRERHALLDLDQKKHQPQRIKLEFEQKDRNGWFRGTMQAELDAVERRLAKRGISRFIRSAMGREQRDQADREAYVKTLAGIDRREREERLALAARQEVERQRTLDTYTHLRRKLEARIAGRVEQQKEYLMDRQDERKRLEANRPRLPKPEPVPRPTWARGDAGPRGRDGSFERQARAWGETEEGRRVLAGRPVQPYRDFQASRGQAPEKAQEPDKAARERAEQKEFQRRADPARDNRQEFARAEARDRARTDFSRSTPSEGQQREAQKEDDSRRRSETRDWFYSSRSSERARKESRSREISREQSRDRSRGGRE